MTIDLATLAIEIDSRDVDTGVRKLDDLTAAGAKAEAAVDRLGDQATQTGRQVKTASQAAAEMARDAQIAARQTTAMGKESRLASHHVQNLTFQLQDMAVGLASGQRPLTVFLQQGSQIQGIMGQAGIGVGGLTKELAKMSARFLPLAALVGTVAAGVGLLRNEMEGGMGADELARELGLTTAELKTLEDATLSFGDVAGGVFDLLADDINNGVNNALENMGLTADEVYTQMVESAKRSANQIIGAIVVVPNMMIAALSSLPAAVADVFYSTAQLAISGINALITAAVQGINTVITQANRIPGVNIEGISAPSLGNPGNPYKGAAGKFVTNVRNAGVGAFQPDYVGGAADAVQPYADQRRVNRLRGAANEIIEDRGGKRGGNSPNRATEQKDTELEKLTRAYEKALKSAQDFREGLTEEAATMGMTDKELRAYRLEQETTTLAELAALIVKTRNTEETRKMAAALLVQAGAIRGAGAAVEQATAALEKEEAAAARLDFERNVLKPLDDEIALRGLVGPAREYAALALEEEAFKAEMAAQGITDVNKAWADYAAKRKTLIDYDVEEGRIQDLADLYEDLFTGGIDNVWDSFKRQGLAVISQIAAQWTLALLSGRGTGSFGAIASQALGQSPLGGLFGGLFGSTPFAANDNGIGALAGGQGSAGMTSGTFGAGVGRVSTAGASSGAQGGFSSLLNVGPVGGALQGLAINQVIGGITGKGSNTGAAIGGAIGSLIPIPGGQIIGAVLGSLLGGAVKSTPRGSAILNGSEVTGFYGNSQSRKDQAGSLGGSITDAIAQIAEALGGTVNSALGKVSIGIRNNSINVDPQGRGYTKTSKFSDIRAFGQDQEAAIRFAISNLIEDGVIEGISAASQSILRSGQDLEKAIEKAVLIENVPKLLKERIDPLGAALDAIDARFKTLADALREGGASAEQFAQAEKLYNLERQDAIEQMGRASQSLKDFLLDLNAGGNSPLSLRQQRLEAERALDPFLQQINEAQSARDEVNRLKAAGATASQIASAEEAARIAAAGINQDGFQSAAQLLLDISRRSNASSGAFFTDFDRIRNLTSSAIGLIDGATTVPGPAQDLFSPQIVANTDYTNRLLENIRDLLIANDNSGGSADLREGGFIGAARSFAG